MLSLKTMLAATAVGVLLATAAFAQTGAPGNAVGGPMGGSLTPATPTPRGSSSSVGVAGAAAAHGVDAGAGPRQPDRRDPRHVRQHALGDRRLESVERRDHGAAAAGRHGAEHDARLEHDPALTSGGEEAGALLDLALPGIEAFLMEAQRPARGVVTLDLRVVTGDGTIADHARERTAGPDPRSGRAAARQGAGPQFLAESLDVHGDLAARTLGGLRRAVNS